jgi:hypothetical protein
MKFLGREINQDGVFEDSYYDDSTNKIHVKQVANISDLLERNKYERDYSNNGFTKERDMRKIAELDMLTVQKLKTEHNIDVFNNDDMPRLKQWLKENRGFMTVNKI